MKIHRKPYSQSVSGLFFPSMKIAPVCHSVWNTKYPKGVYPSRPLISNPAIRLGLPVGEGEGLKVASQWGAVAKQFHGVVVAKDSSVTHSLSPRFCCCCLCVSRDWSIIHPSDKVLLRGSWESECFRCLLLLFTKTPSLDYVLRRTEVKAAEIEWDFCGGV